MFLCGVDHRLVSLTACFMLGATTVKKEYKHRPKRIGIRNEHSFSEEMVLMFPYYFV